MTIEDFLTQLSEHCGLRASELAVSVDENEEEIAVQMDLPEAESGLFIGYHGETLNSIQRILRLAFQREVDKRITLNVNQYREQRREKLIEMAHQAAQQAMESGEPYTFNYYLPAHERYIIHTTISEEAELDGLESLSRGEGKNRRLTVKVSREQADE